MDQTSFATTTSGQSIGDARSLVAHHLLVVGQTGSGKTTSTLSLINSLQRESYTTIIFDPTGEYSKLPNSVTYKLGENAYLEAGQLSAHQLREALQINGNQILNDKLSQAVDALRIQQNIVQSNKPYVKINVPIIHYQKELSQLSDWSRSFAPQNLANQLIEEFVIPYPDERADYSLLGQQYDRQTINQEWNMLSTIRQHLASDAFRLLFDPEPHPGVFKTELNFIIKMFLEHRSSHRTLVIDLSVLKQYEARQRVVISLLLKNLLAVRLQEPNNFPVNIVLDEAHRYLPKDEYQLADNGIFQVLREGRKVGLSMTLTTQSPLDLPARLRSQFANLLLHHLTSPEELASLTNADKINRHEISRLVTGEAILLLANEPGRKINVNLPKWWKNNHDGNE
ncbi:MAG: ATP-binding protein [Limosilactobacillus sp.]|jgi:DNA helicase HerA-like ATPase|uniref:ATP-binding protein n=1 Tax=Limosilactobacillus sp. TaxID=2773925 RepID=UPI0025B8394B|nr:ATP-binding protein [Limosilactobacillus sp.]MCI1974448.1 ATP-binding protein [Limosilactobacillus sp.]MCI2031414.1 ATP-binding protein [Limosilactobacillus sp.]